MDERVLERMVKRSYTTVRNIKALALSSVGIFVAVLIWLSLQPLFRPVESELHIALLFLTLSIGSIIWAPMISILVMISLSRRSGEEEPSIFSLFRSQYKQMGFLASQSVLISLIQFVIVLFIGLWRGIEAIPIVGTALFVLLSWIPALLSGAALVLFILHLLTLFTARISLIESSEELNLTKPWAHWPKESLSDWIIHLKLVLLGLGPMLLFCVAAALWPMPIFGGVLAAPTIIFRAAAFSILLSPLFLFAIHMAIESDRYTKWLSTRRLG
jgi:hypothetical protein